MKRIVCAILALALIVGALGAVSETQPESLLLLLAARDFDALFERSTDDMRAALVSADGLKMTWQQIEGMFGEFSGALTVSQEAEQGGFALMYVSADFEHALVTLMVASDADGKLAGLSIVSFEYKPAPPVEGAFVEKSLLLRAGEADESAAMLTLPEGEGVFPCVILMHGSGASDINEMAYGLPVFAELAHLLASNGVASVRYDKYTYAHPELCARADFTVMDEYLPDVRAALEICESDARIGDIYLLGHSLGARVLPRVMAELGAERVKGGLLIAGTPLALAEIMIRQNMSAIESADVELDARADAIEMLDYERMRLEALIDAPDAEVFTQELFGLPAYYLVEDARADVAGTALALGKPLYIAQGGKDFQVLPYEGIDAWRAALGDAQFVEYAEFPNLTHLLFDMEAEASMSVSDYAGDMRVSESFAGALAEWIMRVSEQ